MTDTQIDANGGRAWSWRWGTYEVVAGTVHPIAEEADVLLIPRAGAVLATNRRRLFATREAAHADALETARRQHDGLTNELAMLAVRVAELEREAGGEPRAAADVDREFDRLGQIDAELRIPAADVARVGAVRVVDDDEDDDPDSTPLEDEHGDPVGSRLEPAGAANDGPAMHGYRGATP